MKREAINCAFVCKFFILTYHMFSVYTKTGQIKLKYLSILKKIAKINFI